MLVTEHIMFQSPLFHSIYLLSNCGQNIKCSSLDYAPMVISFKTVKNEEDTHSFKVWEVKID
jgi:hypothetical protein